MMRLMLCLIIVMRNEFDQAKFGEVINEEREPVENLLSHFEDIYYFFGAIAEKSNLKNENNSETPLVIRAQIARLDKAQKLAINEFEKEEKMYDHINLESQDLDYLIDKAKTELLTKTAEIKLEETKWKIIADQYLRQRTITIDLPGMGSQSARMIDLCLPESLQKPEAKTDLPIFLIPGVSNDVECVGSLAMEAAVQGKRVIVVAYPESFNGQTTDEFATAVNQANNYEPHANFYKTALDHIVGDQQVEIWGYSTGAPITAEILQDSEYQQKVKKAVLICPAGSVDQSQTSLAKGLIKEIRMFKDVKSTANYMLSIGGQNNDKNNLARRKQILKFLMKKITKNCNLWHTAKVAEGGKILVISGENDNITKSRNAEYEFQQNSQAAMIIIPDASHSYPLTHPKNVVNLII